MAKRKIDTSQALFTDFSKGLYLLDTPRGYGDQLASLALTGGRNIWSEKGALIPQYGYDTKATIPNNEKVLLISDDDQSSSSVFLVTQDIDTNKGNVYLYTASQGLKKYKTQIPSITTPIISARTGSNLILTTAGVNYEIGAYYPESEEVTLETALPISTYSTYYEITIDESQKDFYWNGKELGIKSENKIVPVKVVSMYNSPASTPTEVTAEDMDDYIINGDTVRIEGQLNVTDLDTQTVSKIFKTEESDDCNIKIEYNVHNLFITIKDQPNELGLSKGLGKMITEIGLYNYKMDISPNKIYFELYKEGKFVDSANISDLFKDFNNWFVEYYSRQVDTENIDIYRNDENISKDIIDDTRLRMVTLQGTAHQTLTGNVDLVEKTINTLTFKYIPEEPTESNPERTITPSVMGFCANRLCISDVGGVIYYSGIGVVDNFQEILGAGYFRDFSDDNSACLSLEDYYNGVLITKQNGLYFLAFGTDSTDSVSADSSIGIKIKKIAQIGQEFAKDHVIIDKQIIAYDSNSASLLVAAAVNVFGSLVAGKTLVTSEELNAQSFGIPEGKRQLVYNSESQVLILYYGEQLKNGIVYVPAGKSIFPREMDIAVEDFQMFNQGVVGVSEDGKIFQDFKKGTLIEGFSSIANFEPIGLRDNRIICASLLEISELNNIEYDLATTNTQTSLQHIQPPNSMSSNKINTPPMLYSDKKANLIYNSYSTQRKWADKMSNCTRIYAPLSGRYGVSLSFEFPKAEAFCLAAIRINDFSQGD